MAQPQLYRRDAQRPGRRRGFRARHARHKTSGLQEAFNRAHEEVRDVHTVGGGNNSMLQKGVSYRLDQTLRIPWMQDWRLDGGEYVLGSAGTSPTPPASGCSAIAIRFGSTC